MRYLESRGWSEWIQALMSGNILLRELYFPILSPPSPWPLSRCRIMAAVNQNMFDASITIDRPRGASLMVLPLNLIAQIVTNVSFPPHVNARNY